MSVCLSSSATWYRLVAKGDRKRSEDNFHGVLYVCESTLSFRVKLIKEMQVTLAATVSSKSFLLLPFRPISLKRILECSYRHAVVQGNVSQFAQVVHVLAQSTWPLDTSNDRNGSKACPQVNIVQ